MRRGNRRIERKKQKTNWEKKEIKQGLIDPYISVSVGY
jgi:hypothetical protein